MEKTQALLYALNPFLKMRHRMPLRCVEAFLIVALHKGESVSELARRCGVSISTMSRNLHDLGDRDRAGDKGLGLLQWRQNPNNPTELHYELAPKGEALLQQMKGFLQ